MSAARAAHREIALARQAFYNGRFEAALSWRAVSAANCTPSTSDAFGQVLGHCFDYFWHMQQQTNWCNVRLDLLIDCANLQNLAKGGFWTLSMGKWITSEFIVDPAVRGLGGVEGSGTPRVAMAAILDDCRHLAHSSCRLYCVAAFAYFTSPCRLANGVCPFSRVLVISGTLNHKPRSTILG